MDIDPQADRLIFFFSDRRNPHEVMPVFRPRYAITVWYFDHAEKMDALERRRRITEDEPAVARNAQTGQATLESRKEGIISHAEARKPDVLPRKVKRFDADKAESGSGDESDEEDAENKANREKAQYYEI